LLAATILKGTVQNHPYHFC